MSEQPTVVKESRGNFKKRLVIGLSVFATIVFLNYLSFNIGRDLELDRSKMRLVEHLYTFIGLPIVLYYAFGRFWVSLAF